MRPNLAFNRDALKRARYSTLERINRDDQSSHGNASRPCYRGRVCL